MYVLLNSNAQNVTEHGEIMDAGAIGDCEEAYKFSKIRLNT